MYYLHNYVLWRYLVRITYSVLVRTYYMYKDDIQCGFFEFLPRLPTNVEPSQVRLSAPQHTRVRVLKGRKCGRLEPFTRHRSRRRHAFMRCCWFLNISLNNFIAFEACLLSVPTRTSTLTLYRVCKRRRKLKGKEKALPTDSNPTVINTLIRVIRDRIHYVGVSTNVADSYDVHIINGKYGSRVCLRSYILVNLWQMATVVYTRSGYVLYEYVYMYTAHHPSFSMPTMHRYRQIFTIFYVM